MNTDTRARARTPARTPARARAHTHTHMRGLLQAWMRLNAGVTCDNACGVSMATQRKVMSQIVRKVMAVLIGIPAASRMRAVKMMDTVKRILSVVTNQVCIKTLACQHPGIPWGSSRWVDGLPPCCPHFAAVLPPCCPHVSTMLPQCCHHVAPMLASCCHHVALGPCG